MIASTIKKIWAKLQPCGQDTILARKEARAREAIRKNTEEASHYNYLFNNIPAYTVPLFVAQEEAGAPTTMRWCKGS